ncbi:hypothetical protein [Sunxiuqinia rutila]|uniref:hypothetical protein n=1 Tax=Sunxiuqinia rutila TaxID=1397841 RepID=UPI003D36D546
MNIKHRNLEKVRKSPQAITQIAQGTTGGGKTMIRCWDHAVGFYHKEQDVKSARDYLLRRLSSFNDNKKNNEWRDTLINKFDSYLNSYSELNFKNIKVNSRLKMDIQHNNSITGEIFRIDQTVDNGYAVTLQNRQDDIWAHEIRFPLIQIHYSNFFRCPYDLVKVGVYNFVQENHEYISFEEDDLNQAWDEILTISRKVNKINI